MNKKTNLWFPDAFDPMSPDSAPQSTSSLKKGPHQCACACDEDAKGKRQLRKPFGYVDSLRIFAFPKLRAKMEAARNSRGLVIGKYGAAPRQGGELRAEVRREDGGSAAVGTEAEFRSSPKI